MQCSSLHELTAAFRYGLNAISMDVVFLCKKFVGVCACLFMYEHCESVYFVSFSLKTHLLLVKVLPPPSLCVLLSCTCTGD